MRPALTLALTITLTLAVTGCGGPPADPEPGEPVTAEADPSISPASEAISRANRLEDRLALPDSRTYTLPARDGARQGYLLRLWTEGGRPVMLHVEDPDAAGRMRGQSMYYFENGELFFIRRPRERIVLENGRIVEWLDERLQPVPDTLLAQRTAREAEIRSNLDRYLTPFGVSPPTR